MKTKELLKKYAKRYFIDAMGAMALGLFASLLIGTIFNAIGMIPGLSVMSTIGKGAQSVAGAAMAVAIAISLKADPLVVFTCAAVGQIANTSGGAGGPLAVLFIAIIAAEVGQLVSKKTKVDILVTPVVTLIVGFAASWLLCPIVAFVMYYLGVFIATATTFQPLLMGIVVSVVVGVILTLPISSAAICAMIFSESAYAAAVLNGTEEGFLLAGGAAVAGCCAQMVGFAVVSFRENKWGGIVSQGLGTSMLQMGNIVKKPVIWLAPTIAAAITGPVSTMIFKLKCTGVAAGMGTCGLVGPIGVIDATEMGAFEWVGLVLVCIVLPAILAFLFNELFRKLGWIKTGDMKLAD